MSDYPLIGFDMSKARVSDPHLRMLVISLLNAANLAEEISLKGSRTLRRERIAARFLPNRRTSFDRMLSAFDNVDSALHAASVEMKNFSTERERLLRNDLLIAAVDLVAAKKTFRQARTDKSRMMTSINMYHTSTRLIRVTYLVLDLDRTLARLRKKQMKKERMAERKFATKLGVSVPTNAEG